MEHLVNLTVLFAEIASKESFVLLIIICIAQAIVLGIIWRGQYKIKNKYRALTQTYQSQQSSFQQDEFHKISFMPAKEYGPPVITAEKENTLYTAIFKDLQKLMKEDKLYHDSKLTRDEIVVKLGTNRKSFLGALQYFTHLSFIDYTNKFRLEEAVALLENGEYTNETIAEEVGFGSVNTFYRQFRQQYGISPSEYRKSLNENLVTTGL